MKRTRTVSRVWRLVMAGLLAVIVACSQEPFAPLPAPPRPTAPIPPRPVIAPEPPTPDPGVPLTAPAPVTEATPSPSPEPTAIPTPVMAPPTPATLTPTSSPTPSPTATPHPPAAAATKFFIDKVLWKVKEETKDFVWNVGNVPEGARYLSKIEVEFEGQVIEEGNARFLIIRPDGGTYQLGQTLVCRIPYAAAFFGVQTSDLTVGDAFTGLVYTVRLSVTRDVVAQISKVRYTWVLGGG